MIRHIVFDMGQVLLLFDPQFFMDREGIFDAADRELLCREVYRSLEWARMDRGSLSEEEGFDLMKQRLPQRLHEAAHRLVCSWDEPIVPIEGMEQLAKELRESGYDLYLLSNACYKQKTYWPRVPGSQYFSGRLVSAEEKLVKPQPEIYRLLCSRFSLEPSECVFIDDSTSNCEGAWSCGMQAVVFHGDAQELRKKLAALGVRVRTADRP